MGRQTSVAMTDKDEEAFITFLRSSADIQFLEDFAPTIESIWVDSFSPREQGHWTYYIWNTVFGWIPEFEQVRKGSSKGSGDFYVSNISGAPIIEYTRHDFQDRTGLTYGRLYWAKFFAVSAESLKYDVHEFSRWYDQVIRWIRKNGKQIDRGANNTYYLPDAIKQLSV